MTDGLRFPHRVQLTMSTRQRAAVRSAAQRSGRDVTVWARWHLCRIAEAELGLERGTLEDPPKGGLDSELYP